MIHRSTQFPVRDDQIELPIFPTNELIKLVDEIFDTSSDAMNPSYQYIFKETSVQTDIVWKNVNDLFNQHLATRSESVHQIPAVSTKSEENFNNQSHTIGVQPSDIVNESLSLNPPLICYDGSCRHSYLKKCKICSCRMCKSTIRLSAVNIQRPWQRISSSCPSSSSSSPSTEFHTKPRPSAKVKLFPSERYKQMKQAQREHFESDPRISKTLRKIYATAKTLKIQTSTSSSSSHDRPPNWNDSLRSFNSSNNGESNVLQPDLYTSSDEMLLFGLNSSGDNQYSSRLLKTESSQDDTFVSNEKRCYDNKLYCTNSEESSGNLFEPRRFDLEQCLYNDIQNSGSDPAAMSSPFSTSSLERKMSEIQLNDSKSI